MVALNDRQRLDWLRLARVSGVGPRTFQSLINRFGGAAAALEALPMLAKAKGREVVLPPVDEIEREFARAATMGARFIAYGESGYPARLRDIEGPPPFLAVKGRIELLERSAVGIVGSRNASAAGRKLTTLFAHGLGEAGFAVVSGFARGIDAEAHRASLAFGTIGVLAGGLDKPYPPENQSLYEQMGEEGLIVTEMPFGWVPRGRDFPRRNRLISGLSMGVVVIEAARRSGSLITARMANEQGREVFAIPGSPLDPRCEGTNDLLREGATMAASPEDVLAVLRPLAGDEARAPLLFREPRLNPTGAEEGLFDESFGGGAALGDDDVMSDDTGHAVAPALGTPRERLLAALGITPVEVDTLARAIGLEPRAFSALVLDMELGGEIERHAGNRLSLKA